ncbi:LamG domain-containing protein, partial [Nanoarchaeota archaeon]
RIGINGDDSRDWSGNIDDVKIFNRSLSEDQIIALYNNRTDLISSDETSIGDNWSACITPNDGAEDGTEVCTENVTINTLPTVSITEINSSLEFNTTSENITVFFTSSDTDGDSVKNITDWRLNGSSILQLNMPFERTVNGNTNATDDYSMFGNDGVEFGGVTWNATGGYDGFGAYQFDNTSGNDQYIEIPWSQDLVDFTYTAWIKPETVSGTYHIIQTSSAATHHTYFRQEHQTLKFLWRNMSASTENFATGNVLTANEWNFIAATIKNSSTANHTNATIYHNGIEVKNFLGGELGSVDNFLTIGASRTALGSNPLIYNGTIDEVMVYNIALSPEQIWALYENKTYILASGDTSPGDNWSVCITPNDGAEDGTEVCTANLTINTLPTATITEINSSLEFNTTSENITVFFTSTDIDGTDTKNITDWRLNGTSIAVLNMPFERTVNGNTNATDDYSMNGNDGTEYNSTLWNSTGGYDGKGAYEFDGNVNQRYISLNKKYSEITGTENNTDISICAWFKTVDLNIGTIVGTYVDTGSSGVGIVLYTQSGKVGAKINAKNSPTGQANPLSGTGFHDGAWHHACITCERFGNGTLYADGVEVDSEDISLYNETLESGTKNIGIGASSIPNWFFNGTIDDVLIFNSSLSAEQVKALYENKTYILASGDTSPGDNWSACITPNDGAEDGTEVCTANLTINSLPTVTITEINSSLEFNTTSENITVFFTSSDLDGEDVKNVTDWRLNGSSIAILNMPFERTVGGDTNDTETKDYSTFGNVGTEYNGVLFNATGGYDGKGAYEFDGDNDYIIVPDSASLDVSNTLSFSFWAKAEDLSHSGGGNCPRLSQKSTSWYVCVSNVGTITTYLYGPDDNSQTSTGGIFTTNAWHHFVLTYDSSTGIRNIYFDGDLDDTETGITGGVTISANDLWIGEYSNIGRAWNGTIDEVLIFNHSLTPEQVYAMYINRTDLISWNETSRGDNWSACITPNDGTQDGTMVCTENLTINTLPTATITEINSSLEFNTTSENITVHFTSADIDGSDTKNITDWRLNGSSIAVLNLPFEHIIDDTLNATKDYSMSGNDGSEHNSIYFNATGGYDGKGAYEFNDDNSSIHLGSDDSLSPQIFSISAWVKLDKIGISQVIVSNSPAASWTFGRGYRFRILTTNKVKFDTGNSGWNSVTGDKVLTISKWHHVVGTHNGSDMNIYVDGVFDTTATSPTPGIEYSSPNNVYIGVDEDSAGKFRTPFNGTIDDLMIFNHSLSPEQVWALYENRTDLIDWNETYPGDNWSVCITPNDGSEDGTEVCTENVTINTLPT